MDHALPDAARFEEIARDTVAGFPAPFIEAAMTVAICIAEWPDREMLASVGLSDPTDLTGLYDGIPMTQKSHFDQPLGPDTVWLFRQPILAEWRARGSVELDDLIAHVTVHEFAHHFGWSDDDIAAVDRWWE